MLIMFHILCVFQYCTGVTKFDRHGYKPRNRVMIVTDKTIYVLNDKDFKTKDKIPYSLVKGKFCMEHIKLYRYCI